MENIAVIGAGLMGHSIALTVAWQGIEVKLRGIDDDDLERARKGISAKIETLLQGGLISVAESREIPARIGFFTSVEEAVEHATFVIEAIPEDLNLKQNFYEHLDSLCPVNVILASNTSGLAPSEISAKMRHPERMTVVHFWNPAHLVPLVEVAGGRRTSRETIDRAMSLLISLKKKPIEVLKEIPGFIGNRLQYALFREAQYLLDSGAASKEDIDAAVTYSLGRRLPVTGPLMSADLGGLDVFHAISEYLFADLSKSDGSLETMRSLIQEGRYGLKTGSGFYQWDKETAANIQADRERVLIDFLKRDRGL